MIMFVALFQGLGMPQQIMKQWLIKYSRNKKKVALITSFFTWILQKVAGKSKKHIIPNGGGLTVISHGRIRKKITLNKSKFRKKYAHALMTLSLLTSIFLSTG